MAPTKLLFTLSLLLFFLFKLPNIHCFTSQNDNGLEDDIAYLESQEIISSITNDLHHTNQEESPSCHGSHDQEAPSLPNIDEKDVVILKENNFTDFIEKNRYVMVEFYAPWCGHCQALAPEYAAAATELKDVVALAKVDGMEESELLKKYEIEGFPTLIFFVDGAPQPFEGGRSKDAIVNWLRKKTGPSVYNITTTVEAEKILATESKIVLGFFDTLVGLENEELAAASRLEDDVAFYQTSNPDVARLFSIEPQVHRPALVLLKKEEEKLSYFDGQFLKSEIAQFVSSNKLPLVIPLSMENAPSVFSNPVKNQLFLFATSNDAEQIAPIFQEAARVFKGKVLIVSVDIDSTDFGKQLSDYFGASGDAPTLVGYKNGDGTKYAFNGEFSSSNIKSFAEDLLANKLQPFFKSDPIPETNDGDVKIVVGNNFDKIVLDESKDVLLEVYAPWCGHCQALEPIYNRLGKYLKGIDSLVIAKMDGTTNEHPRVQVEGFPTLLFFPAGKKSLDPIPAETARTVVALYKFLKEHASTPFKLQKPASTENVKDSDAQNQNTNNNLQDYSKNENVKDEL